MTNFPFEFDDPGWLLLILLVPLIWWLSIRSLSALGPVRRLAALLIRSLVMLGLIFALADVHWKQPRERTAVIYLFDRSLSIPQPLQPTMVEYARREIAKHRDSNPSNMAGAIVFGGGAALEYPPVNEDIPLTYNQEIRLDVEHTNLAAALRLAAAAFPETSARRIVVLSDGDENIGDCLEQARSLSAEGIGIDVLPIRYPPRDGIAVEKITVPPSAQRGQPFELRVVLDNNSSADAAAHNRTGQLRILRKTHDEERILITQAVSIAPGKHAFNLREQIDTPDFYTYQADFTPDDAKADRETRNKRATAFTDVRGQGEVLLIEPSDHRGQFDYLIDRLRHENLRVTVQSSRETFTSLADLQPYDTVMLADVAREDFSDAQIKMLASNTQQLGAGLVMLGGPNGFGAGGWSDTPIEEAMPVDFHIKNAKVLPVGALALLIDRSGSMTGEKLTMAKTAAIAACRALADHDYVTVATFDFEPHLVVPLTKKQSERAIESRIARIDADGGTNMRPGILMVHEQLLQAADASVRHIVILTDGLTEGKNYPELVAQLRHEGITISTVGVGPDADVKLLDELARVGGGRFYAVKSPKILPRIFQDEARVVSRPLVFEHTPAFAPRIIFPNELIRGLTGFPPLSGYVRTQLKDNTLVESVLANSLPADDSRYNTLLASWNYGLGKAVAFTSDAGQAWASAWKAWPGYDKFFSQIVRWSMRPLSDAGKFTLSTVVRDGRVNVVITAIDKDNDFLNFLNMSARVLGPNMEPIDVSIRQVAPGRYVGDFPAEQTGSYMLMVSPGPAVRPLLAGVNIPYSAELSDREPNENLLRSLASLVPRGGRAGQVIDDHSATSAAASPASAAETRIEKWLDFNTFRGGLAISVRTLAAWHIAVWIAGLLFFFDIAVRRIRIELGWLVAWGSSLVRSVVQRPAAAAPDPVFARLRNSKIEVGQSLQQRLTSLRFEPSGEAVAATARATDDAPYRDADQPPSQSAVAGTTDAAPGKSYTERLLQAKKQAAKDFRSKQGLPADRGRGPNV